MDIVSGLILVVFIGTYVAISSEKVNRTATSLLGMGLVGVILWAFGTEFIAIVELVEWHTILFLTAMMIIVTIAASSGMFQYIALELTKPTRGDTRRLFVTFLVFVFGMSLFLDTATTMLVMGPLTIEVCRALEIDFKPFLISEAITCNFASIPTVVGAIPNIVIVDKTGLDSGIQFAALMPLAVILFVVALPLLLRWFNEQLVPGQKEMISQMMQIDSRYMIRSRRDFYMSIGAMIILILGFTIGPVFSLDTAMLAIILAAVLLIASREWVDDILPRVNWSTIFFLVGLFGLVAALTVTGIIIDIGVGVSALIGDNEILATVFMIWVPAVLSGVIDNIPVSAVLAPIATQFPAFGALVPLALIIAVNVGGFLLPIGAPANIIALALAEKEHDRISMKSFVKISAPLALLMLSIGTVWLLLVEFVGLGYVAVGGTILGIITFVFVLLPHVRHKQNT
ncbi:MAG: SLC13 family permease [Candidatus Thorarchaeota archaeon]|jgi:Na+/H+ antiporter NhaD/arsenite permease-like protein